MHELFAERCFQVLSKRWHKPLLILTLSLIGTSPVLGAPKIRDRVMKFGQGESLIVKLINGGSEVGPLVFVGTDSFVIQTVSSRQTISFRDVRSVELTPAAKIRRAVTEDFKSGDKIEISWTDGCSNWSPARQSRIGLKAGCPLRGVLKVTASQDDSFEVIEEQTGIPRKVFYTDVRDIATSGEKIFAGAGTGGVLLAPAWIPFAIGKGKPKFAGTYTGIVAFLVLLTHP
jgi:hypothetical protein